MATLTLLAHVEGDEPEQCLLVSVPATGLINDLKSAIYEEVKGEFGRMSARRLDVRKLKDPAEIRPTDSFIARIKDQLERAEKLENQMPILECWPAQPDVKKVGIWVGHPNLKAGAAEDTVGELNDAAELHHQRALGYGKTGRAASDILKSTATYNAEQTANPIFNGRPFSRLGLPICAFDPILARLQDDFEDLETRQLNAECVALTAELFFIVQRLHLSEDSLLGASWPVLNKLLRIFSDEMKEKHQLHLDGRLIAESDGAVWVPLADPTQYAIALHYEKKVPLLEGDIQSALTFRKHVAHTPQLSGAAFATCLPCIHVTIAGSYIRFSASMLGEELFVHHYTDYLSLAGPGDLQYIRRRVDHISKHFDVVREALQSLRQYYKGVQPRSRDTKDPARLRPNPTLRPTSTRSSHTRLEGLVFEDRMSFGDMQYNPALWRARYRGRPALVKFTERYSVRTHQLLAGCSPPKAPELYFAEKIVGGIWMIVMKRLKETNAENTFLDQALPSSVVNDVKAALDVLHKGGLVFGDLRRSNIMVQLENDVYRAKLIDFDNSGREVASDDPAAAEYEAGGPWYDPFLNPWPGLPQEIQPSKPMRAAHDLAMLELISPSDRLGLNEQGQVFWSK